MTSVLLKYTDGASDAQKQAWRDGVAGLIKTIPQIKEIHMGNKVKHFMNQGWDDAAVITFANAADAAIYTDAKSHREYQAATKEQTGDKLIFDFEGESLSQLTAL